MDQLYTKLMQMLDRSAELEDIQIAQRIDSLLLQENRERYIPLSQRKQLRALLFNKVRRLDILQELLDDDTVTEIMVNGPDHIFIEREGRIIPWHAAFENREKLEDIIQQIAAYSNRTVNAASAIADARLSQGERVSIVMPPVAPDGPILTIRRFPSQPIGMDRLILLGSISEEAASFLQTLVISKYNIFISGGTGSGKTTFLNALSGYIPKDERIITIEDNAELQIRGVDNLVRLEARKAAAGGKCEVTIRDLIKASLRMRPDRIIVGEVRGAEAVDMLQAYNTGHDGSLSTGHANSPEDMLSRLEVLYSMAGLEIPLSAIRRQIASGIDILIHLSRMRDKTRKVISILEITGYDYASGEILSHPLFSFRENGEDPGGRIRGQLEQCDPLVRTLKLERAGLEVTGAAK